MRVLKQSTARTIAVFLTDSSDHVSGKTGATLTVTASKNGAAFASISPTVTELSNGWYSVALTTSHTDTLGDLAIHATASGADPIDTLSQVVAYNPADSVRLGLTALPNAAAEASGGLITRGSGTGQMLVLSGLCSASVATDGLGAASIASGAYAAIADAIWDEARSGHTTTGTFGAYVLARDDAGAALATASALSSVAGDVSAILDDTGTSGVVVASIGTGGIASSSFAAGAIDAAAIAADAIGSSELAASAVTEIATAVLTTQMTESYATDGTAPTPAQSLFLIQQHLSDASISGTTKTVKKIDGSTTAATFTLNSSTTPTSITRAT